MIWGTTTYSVLSIQALPVALVVTCVNNYAFHPLVRLYPACYINVHYVFIIEKATKLNVDQGDKSGRTAFALGFWRLGERKTAAAEEGTSSL